MGITDSKALLKLQENLLIKGDQNKAFTRKLGRCCIVLRIIEQYANLECYGKFANWLEDIQLSIGKGSRNDFIKALEVSKAELEQKKEGV